MPVCARGRAGDSQGEQQRTPNAALMLVLLGALLCNTHALYTQPHCDVSAYYSDHQRQATGFCLSEPYVGLEGWASETTSHKQPTGRLDAINDAHTRRESSVVSLHIRGGQ